MSSKFDISEDDFLISKKSVLILIDQLIEEYSDFTNDVSPKHWRTTGHHITELKKMRDEIKDRLTPITIEEKEIDWVKDARKKDDESKEKIASDMETVDRIENEVKAVRNYVKMKSSQMNNHMETVDGYLNKNRIKKFESFENKISHISKLKVGDKIIYQGSKCEVLTEDDFSIRVKSLQTDREFTINQGQIEESGLRFA
jgi:uncharacterized protein with PIN domain